MRLLPDYESRTGRLRQNKEKNSILRQRDYKYSHEAIHSDRSPWRAGRVGFWATCLEVPGTNGQGATKEECLANLREAIPLILETEREEVFRLDPKAETAELLLA